MNQYTVADLLKLIPFKKVERALKYHYPDMRKMDWKGVHTDLLARKLGKPKHEDGELIEISNFNMQGDYEKYPVTDEMLVDDAYYSIHTNLYSMSFRSWDTLLQVPISLDTIIHYTPQDIIAHFMWEVTWYGTEDDMKKESKKLNRITKELLKKLDKEKA